ncbi:MAG TPA: ABC transporter ATP-binding protein [Phycisphaerales bacterium]|nr:ABC transporter ATP-binding protein [Phycisphaerales bacterium]HIB50489.1 ABC transporter ATP-binding protein [Phycisphaerales bacterium]HIN84368.1 ABC transporter ATP-binding protein [Phycisphaerales bacterium]HIO19661.1 ABC transporter ATP-binding protein [Phycisphaerales bacterium]HIO53276.1 ABC transporter ATP-binding protein [Phycisphaerales bacterium]
MAVIQLQDVEKVYRGKVHALRGVSIEVMDGEIFGLLGPNGAGKSTLVKILMTVIHASKVSGTMLGNPIGNRKTLENVGYLPEHHRFPYYLTGKQVLHHYGALCKVGRKERNSRSSSLLTRLGLAGWENKKVETYSKGMLQRLGIAQALMNNPTLLILDEPTDGVDPVGRREIRDLLAELREEGRAVFLNSHLLSELEMVCDRVAIMVKGRVTMQGTIQSLTVDSQRYEIKIAGEMPAWAKEHCSEVHGNMLVCKGNDPSIVQPILDRLRSENITIVSVNPVRENLEDLFMRAVDNTDSPGAIQ